MFRSSEMRRLFILAPLVLGFAAPAEAGYLNQSQQLAMYRQCRQAYAGYDMYFAKKMCGCTVQAFIRDIPAEEAGVTCFKYAKFN